jgi:hypothetical protein
MQGARSALTGGAVPAFQVDTTTFLIETSARTNRRRIATAEWKRDFGHLGQISGLIVSPEWIRRA